MSNIAKAKLYKEAFDLLKQAQELLIAARKKHERQLPDAVKEAA